MVIHEAFVGLYQCHNIKADTIVSVMKGVLLHFNLDLSRCRGQCYDGASNMAGSRNGVKSQLLMLPCSFHSLLHALSLTVGDSIKHVKSLRSNLDTTYEISKLFEYSAKRHSQFKRIKADISHTTIAFRTLCPTHWTVRNETFHGIMENYKLF